MKINKIFWISALILLLSIPIVLAQTNILRNPYLIFSVNVLIIWIVLFILQAVLIQNKISPKLNVVIYIATFILSLVIAWNWVADPPGRAYIWEVGLFSGYFGPYFNRWFIVNTIILTVIGYFGLGLLGVEPKTTAGKIGMVLLVILFAGIVAKSEFGNNFIWEDKNTKKFFEYLFGPETPTGKKDRQGNEIYKGGILTYGHPNYRLFVFLGSALLFSWFFNAYLKLGDSKISYAMAIIIAANLANRGTPTSTIITIGEIFSFLIVKQQIQTGFQGTFFGTVVSWTIPIILVSWIFCAVFAQSQIGAIVGRIPIAGRFVGAITGAECIEAGGVATSATGSTKAGIASVGFLGDTGTALASVSGIAMLFYLGFKYVYPFLRGQIGRWLR